MNKPTPYPKPMTLYVQAVEINPSLDGMLTPAMVALDAALTKDEARTLRDALNKYLDNVTAGEIRVRLIGRGVL